MKVEGVEVTKKVKAISNDTRCKEYSLYEQHIKLLRKPITF